MTDGLNLCQVVAGEVSSCVAMASDALLIGPTAGSYAQGLAMVIGPFLTGILIGTILKIVRRAGTL